MIVGIPNKVNRLVRPRALRRAAPSKPLITPKRRLGLFTSFSTMMERHADLIVRGLGD